jgi:hypothetical protein
MLELTIASCGLAALAGGSGMLWPHGSAEQRRRFMVAYVFMFCVAGLTYFSA